ncbi:D-alanyl-D-alanine carboxypeptidase family protein [Paracoccus sp. MBLB3053]|uniref:D-alanyl-D-alanine carboxypeptidase family protein n=1 Tax=Paracoccus aurantius TaxID=3073814 RepID=A0ABU2HU01_9RHOB|nr:D-alanyl-D-alanine carboxypeptidase family protein [Paracoccus sp. MBLB3053]MDS9468533.1 D-alanyl-D-alanine carboxypeptidase family protein [Paracoccus sp. MBLB3053]
MDARTGKEIYSQNADTRLHPASLTKMMTLYMAFTAIERGQVRLDSKFTVSSHAAAQPPSKLGLKPGQKIELRYLIRAAAVKSANDAATAIGEGLAGSEPKFAAQMTAMAKALGMRNTNFRNANGLTSEGHYSSARDMTLLGRRLFYDFPQYYSIFSRRSADAGIATVSSTNKRFLDAYEGADGIKTGYTRAAGFNLTASAKRGSKRIIATVLGGNSTAHRNQVMAQLLDAGFGKAPTKVREVRPAAPEMLMVEKKVVRRVQVARVEPQPVATAQLSSSDRPVARASTVNLVTPAAISAAVARAQSAARDQVSDSSRPSRRPQAVATASTKGSDDLVSTSPRPTSRPEGDITGDVEGGISAARPIAAPRGEDSASIAKPTASLFLLDPLPQPQAAPEGGIILSSRETSDDARGEVTEFVSRDDSGDRGYGVSLGLYRSMAEAERLLLRTALKESVSLATAESRVDTSKRGYEAVFSGMSKDMAELACGRLVARQQACTVLTP